MSNATVVVALGLTSLGALARGQVHPFSLPLRRWEEGTWVIHGFQTWEEVLWVHPPA